jgi:ABC-type Fe3+ transport system permease subunit
MQARFLRRIWLWLIILATAGVPVVWALWAIASDPRVLLAGVWDGRMLSLFVHTFAYALASALVATLLAIPVAMAMGRSTSRPARALWLIVPLPLLLPSMVTGYGWQQFLAGMGVNPVPQSTSDIARCIGILATWLLPVPALAVAMTLRRIDQSLIEQALIDGVLLRLLLRRLVAPATLGIAVCVVLAMQEFAIFEPTGISVMATEVRMIFETGRLSGGDNPIAALVGGVGVASTSDLPGRASLALAAGVPVITLSCVLAGVALIITRRLRLDETIELAPPPTRLGAGWGWTIGAWLIVLTSIGLPIGAMVVVLDRAFNPIEVTIELWPQLKWSVGIAIATGAVGMLIASLAAMVRPRLTLLVALGSFLIGGQFTAIALLRLFGTSEIGVQILDSNLPVVLAHVSRFAWIALLAGATLHGGAWRSYQEMAGVDGASAWQSFYRVILGMGWSVILLAGLLMGALSLTEVPATALLVPPSLVPMLLTWVHMQRYGPMMEASLILCVVVLLVGWTSVILWTIVRSRTRSA